MYGTIGCPDERYVCQRSWESKRHNRHFPGVLFILSASGVSPPVCRSEGITYSHGLLHAANFCFSAPIGAEINSVLFPLLSPSQTQFGTSTVECVATSSAGFVTSLTVEHPCDDAGDCSRHCVYVARVAVCVLPAVLSLTDADDWPLDGDLPDAPPHTSPVEDW